MTTHSNSEILEAVVLIAYEAGQKILEIYETDFAVDEKSDASPVTDADRIGETIITNGLGKFDPSIPVLAEEAASGGDIPELGDTFFLVDPLDGTKEFINKTGEFTVNIALIRNGRPVLGVVYAPAINKLYAGGEEMGAFLATADANGIGERKAINIRKRPDNGLVAVASRSHRTAETDAFLDELNVTDFTAAGSSLKFCLLAEGAADVYPRFGRTMEWDTGAGQAVLEAAGGVVMSYPDDKPLGYNKTGRGYDNPFFIAWGEKD